MTTRSALFRPLDNPGGETHRNSARGNVAQDDRICANPRVGADVNRAQYFSPGSNVDMAINDRSARAASRSDGDLLKNETIDANFCIGMNNNAIGVWN